MMFSLHTRHNTWKFCLIPAILYVYLGFLLSVFIIQCGGKIGSVKQGRGYALISHHVMCVALYDRASFIK